ncbi:MAG: pyrimidine reductase family protein [Propionibacteriales bacterium]|nr:pyrimidine reductase family protein [Propionibacteriales bacterium]
MQSLYPTSPSELDDGDLAGLYAYPSERRWVRANFVTTLDGAAQGSDDRSGSLSSKADQRVFAILRSLCDVVVVGANTARVEGYLPVLAAETSTQLRNDLGLASVPAIAIVSRSLRIDSTLLQGGDAPTFVITTESAPVELRREVEALVRVIVVGDDGIDWGTALDRLGGHGYQRVLCEGGPSLMRDLVASGQLDELCLTLTPHLTAGDRLRITHGEAVDPVPRLHLRHLLEADGELFCRYTTH